MKKFLNKIKIIFNKLKKWIIFFIFLYSDYKQYSKKNKRERFPVQLINIKPYLKDNTNLTNFDSHYIYHPAWAARIIAKTKPEKHFDISSSLSFSTIISAFTAVKFYDYRPANINLSNMTSEKANLLSLPFADNSISSLSCMHTVEHIGLGRYGDNIDPDADLKAINELKRVLAVEGNLLFVVPIGQSKLIFNAHRIYSYDQIIEYFKKFRLKEFTLIPDNAIKTGIVYNATKELADEQKYGCGCFWFTKNIQSK